MPHPADRVRFSDGRLLTAADLDADLANEDRLRRRHVRALHGTWGVALGMVLSPSHEGPWVTIGPGVAYDALGREIVLSAATRLDLPYPPDNGFAVYTLVCAYGPDGPRLRTRTVQHDGTLVDDPVHTGLEIVLGRVDVAWLGHPRPIVLTADTGNRDHARADARPRIASGAVPGDRIDWGLPDFPVYSALFDLQLQDRTFGTGPDAAGQPCLVWLEDTQWRAPDAVAPVVSATSIGYGYLLGNVVFRQMYEVADMHRKLAKTTLRWLIVERFVQQPDLDLGSDQ